MTPTGSKRQLHLRKASKAAALGCAIVLGPCLLDHWATAQARRAVQVMLERRLGARVTMKHVRPVGPFGLEIRGLSARWPGAGSRRLDLPALRVRFKWRSALGLRLRVASLEARGGQFEWRQHDAVAGLGRLARRVLRRRSRRGSGAKGGGARLAFRLQLDRIVVQELSAARARYGLAALDSRNLRIRRSARGRWAASLGRSGLSAGEGLVTELEGLTWEGQDRRTEGVRTRRLRVANGVVRVEGERGSARRFSLLGDEVAPDLLELEVMSPPGRGAGQRRVDASARGLTVRAVLDGLKRQARAEAGGRIGLSHLGRLTRVVGVGLRDARLRGVVRGTVGAGRIRATTDVVLTDVDVNQRLLASRAVRWPRVGVKVTARFVPRTRRLTLEEGELRVGSVGLRLRGWLTFRRRSLQAKVEITLPATPCAELFDALPRELVPRLRGMRFAGRLGARLELALDTRSIKDLTLGVSVRPRRCRVQRDPPGARIVDLRKPFTFVTRPPGWKPTRLVMGPKSPSWRAYPAIGRNVVAAFLAAEDRRFFRHRGFDLENIRRALADNLAHRTLTKGASSISQQVVKNVFLSHQRNLSRKLQEAILTWRLEQVLSKRRILEIYLNLVEMGPGIFGVRAASKRYFHRESIHLNPLQAAHLAAITPSPRRQHARFRKGRAGMKWLLHLRYLLFQMFKIGWLEKSTYEKYRYKDLRLISYQ